MTRRRDNLDALPFTEYADPNPHGQLTLTDDPEPGHVCEACGAALVQRPAAGQTYEQRFSGTWWDHPQTAGCFRNTTALDPSPALLAQLAAQADRRNAR